MPLTDDEIWNVVIKNQGSWRVLTGCTEYKMHYEESRDAINFVIPKKNGGMRVDSDRVPRDKYIYWYKIFKNEKNIGQTGRDRNLYRNKGPKRSLARRATYLLPLFELTFEQEKL